jgi:hypothetical protein
MLSPVQLYTESGTQTMDILEDGPATKMCSGLKGAKFQWRTFLLSHLLWVALSISSFAPAPYLIRAVQLQLRVEAVIQSGFLDDDSDLVFTVWRQALHSTKGEHIIFIWLLSPEKGTEKGLGNKSKVGRESTKKTPRDRGGCVNTPLWKAW